MKQYEAVSVILHYNEHIQCHWAEPSETSTPEDEARSHAAHGDRMDECDAWVCICGNNPELLGFYPCDADGDRIEHEDGTGLVFCDQCGRIIERLTGRILSGSAPQT
jgi:hypothetical protein